jgi:hypothetical protein
MPREWDTEKERLRKQAYRERKKAEKGTELIPAPEANAELVVSAADVLKPRTDPEPEPHQRVFSCSITEDDYARRAVNQTLAYVETFTAPEKKTKQAIQERLMRAEAYARWRYKAWERGEVFSL